MLLNPPPVARAPETIAVSELPAPGTDADHRLAALLARMRAVFVFSSASRAEIASRYAIPRDRIERVTVGCEHWRRALAELPPREDPPLVLVLGALRRARRHVAILEAVELLAARGRPLRLRCVGRRGDAFDEMRAAVERSAVRTSVRWDETLPESALPAVVAGASALVHLSDREATPVTPLEAFAVGLPVVASRLAAFEEALDGRAELVDNAEIARAPDRLAAAIERAIASSRDEAACSERMLVAREFTWERCARATLAGWRRALGLVSPAD